MLKQIVSLIAVKVVELVLTELNDQLNERFRDKK